MNNELTTEERKLLQRYYDEEISPAEVQLVQALLNQSQPARIFMAALEELTVAVRAAEEWVWNSADAPSAETVASAAAEAASMSDASLQELAPLLERFWDGEVVAEEMAAVSALLQERPDVADYLERLEEIRASVRVTHDEALAGVDFSGLWGSIESRIDAAEMGFKHDEHRVLLYRYHDAEANEAERAQVDVWRKGGDPEVGTTLQALEELRLAATVAVETAQERVDFGGFWHAVENGIDDEIEAQGENVHSLQRARRERKGFLSDYRQGVFAAVATLLAITLVGGLFKDQLFTPAERVIVEKTVVIVDSVEYQPGSSVMVNSPMEPVSATIEAPDGASAEQEEDPTVIWLIDNSGDDTESGKAPATGSDSEQDGSSAQPEEEQPI